MATRFNWEHAPNEPIENLRRRVMDAVALVLDNALGVDDCNIEEANRLREDLGMEDNDVADLILDLEAKFFKREKLPAREWMAALVTVWTVINFLIAHRPPAK